MKKEKEDHASLAAVASARSAEAATVAPHVAPRVIDGPWGYACVEADAVFIPAVMETAEWPLRRVLAELFTATGCTRMIFSAILDADDLRPRLRHIVREWDEYVPQLESDSHCIEIRYEPNALAKAEGRPQP